MEFSIHGLSCKCECVFPWIACCTLCFGNASVAAVPSFPLAHTPALQLCRLRPMLFLKQTHLLRILQENCFKTAMTFNAFTSLKRSFQKMTYSVASRRLFTTDHSLLTNPYTINISSGDVTMTTQAKIFPASLYEPSVILNRLHRLYVGIGTIRFIFIQRQ